MAVQQEDESVDRVCRSTAQRTVMTVPTRVLSGQARRRGGWARCTAHRGGLLCLQILWASFIPSTAPGSSIENADAWTVSSAADPARGAVAEDHRMHDHHGGKGPAALLPPPERPGAAERLSKTTERGACIIFIFWSSGFAIIQGLAFIAAIWAQHPPSRRLRGWW